MSQSILNMTKTSQDLSYDIGAFGLHDGVRHSCISACPCLQWDTWHNAQGQMCTCFVKRRSPSLSLTDALHEQRVLLAVENQPRDTSHLCTLNCQMDWQHL